MREILFRGKQEDNGEWITGFLVDAKHIGDWVNANPVDSTTVGQYTGLNDKRGTKIFEGDIVRTKKYGKIIGHANVNDFDVFEVQYEPCMFRLVNKNRGFNLVDDGFSKLEIIGNIHDNPELAKGGSKP